ncbi:hypothetical protein [Aquimarina algiphila]|uniref:Uncharacterized protein n=1 Tax=Aquimarina algiphila TaxID=2047982 RepID=A0A554VBG5_9FLAO|nr:hypothetical protein [Aquimarina algiphila]TSE03824.1 hypothetical protein FOF46_28380 [Aquimarina algiphila]
MNENYTFEQKLTIAKGRKGTIAVGTCMILFSIFTNIYLLFYAIELNAYLIFKHAFRVLATIGILTALYQGKEWAKYLLLLIVSLAFIYACVLMFRDTNIVFKILMSPAIFIYGIAIYFFSFSPNFKAFFKDQNKK